MRGAEQLNLDLGETDEVISPVESSHPRMEHVAIMKKSWGLLPKILSGEKRIESRWSITNRAPFGMVHQGEVIYFKDSGEPITVRAIVDKVDAFSNLTPERVQQILEEYGEADGLTAESLPGFVERFKNKKYCLLIHLRDPQKIEPFEIDKTGFGTPSAWLCVDDVNKLRKQGRV